MKTDRHKKILEVIDRYEVGTQEELAKILNDEGYNVTQATVSRDIRELNLSKSFLWMVREQGMQHLQRTNLLQVIKFFNGS